MGLSRLRLFSGLRFKMVGAFVGVLIPAFLVTGYLTFDQTSRALKRQKQEDELVIAKNIAAQVEEVLTKARKTVETTAELPEIKNNDPEGRLAALTLVIKVTELLDGLILWDLNGRALLTDAAEPDTQRLFPNSALDLFVRPCLGSEGTVVSDVYRSETGEPAVGISAPIRVEGHPVGVLTAGVLLNNHSLGGIEEIRIGKSGYAYLVDALGQIIAHPQQNRLFEDIRQNPPVQELAKKRGPGVTDFINAEGIRVVAAHAPVAGTGWGVVVRQPASESYVYVKKMFSVLGLIFILILCLSVVAGVLLAWLLTRPLADLAEGVRRVTSGNLGTTVPVTTQDELGALGKAFNEMTARLRRMIEEAATAEKRLAHNEKLAAVGQLAAGVAHEINNPLTVISGFAEHLKDNAPLTGKNRAHLEDILRETERCQSLVANLLGFARQAPPHTSLVDVESLVDETIALVLPQANPIGVGFAIQVKTQLPPLNLDRDQMKQVLLNILFNACQAMPRGGQVTITFDSNEAEAIVEIRDTGPGIPPESLHKIFTPFFTTKENGTGLGLALSYAFVERHGGSLRAENPLSGGTCFTIRLPLPLKEDSPVPTP